MTPVMESEEHKFFFFSPLSYLSRSLCLFRVCTQLCVTWEGRSFSALIEATARVSQRQPLALRAYTLPLCPQNSYSHLSRDVQMRAGVVRIEQVSPQSGSFSTSARNCASECFHEGAQGHLRRGAGEFKMSTNEYANITECHNTCLSHACDPRAGQIPDSYHYTCDAWGKKKGDEGIALHVSLCA